MATKVIMPQMGESIFEGTITKWLKKVGDRINRDEPLFEISTDKVDSEIPSPASGTLTEILVPEGQTVQINTVVALIDGEAEKRAAATAEETLGQRPAPPVERAAEAPSAPPEAPRAAPAAEVGVAETVPMTPMRKAIAEHMVSSRRTSAHVSTVFEVDMGAVLAARDKYKERFEQREGVRLTVT